jgi:hypothetical protein
LIETDRLDPAVASWQNQFARLDILTDELLGAYLIAHPQRAASGFNLKQNVTS